MFWSRYFLMLMFEVKGGRENEELYLVLGLVKRGNLWLI